MRAPTAGAILVVASRARLVAALRWFTSRNGLVVLTCMVSLALLGYVYNSLQTAWTLNHEDTTLVADAPPVAPCHGGGNSCGGAG